MATFRVVHQIVGGQFDVRGVDKLGDCGIYGDVL